MDILVSKLKNNISKKDKKIVIIILLELICIILAASLYTQVSAKQLLTKHNNIDNIQEEVRIKAQVNILDEKEKLNFSVISKAKNSNFLNIKNARLKPSKNGFELTGDLEIKDILTFSESTDPITISYKFDKNKNLQYGKLKLKDTLDNEIIDVVSENISNGNENLDPNDIKKSIKCSSNSEVIFSSVNSNIVDEVFSAKLIEQLKTLDAKNVFDESLLNIKVNKTEYTLNKSTINEAKNDDTVIKKDNVVFYLNNKTIYGISGKISDIKFHNIKSEKDIIKSLGEPTNKINDTSYWEIKNMDKILYITYSNDYIEIMYK